MKNYFFDFLEYTYHYNRVMIGFYLKNRNKFSEKAIRLINHTINTHQIWNARILEQPEFSVWQINPNSELKQLNEGNYEISKQILTVKDLEEKVVYKNSKGQKYTNTLAEIFFHLINHSTYHRGQINQLIKEAGMEPPLTDYIFYKRN